MLSPPDILIIGAAALIFFGPDQLPKVAKRAGQVVREVQNTSQSFIREMERAADDVEIRERAAAAHTAAAEPPPAERPAPHSAESSPMAPDPTQEHGADEMLLPFATPLLDHAALEPKPDPPPRQTYEI